MFLYVIQVSLEDLYNGKTSRLAVNRNILCSMCGGIGGKKVSNYKLMVYLM